MKDEFDLDQFSSGIKAERVVFQTKTKPARQNGLFLKGPIPWIWLTRAAVLPGKALHVGIALWFYAGLTKSQQVGLNQSRLKALGIARDSARRGLRLLEDNRLVAVKRHAGRKPIVTILKCREATDRKKKRTAQMNAGGLP